MLNLLVAVLVAENFSVIVELCLLSNMFKGDIIWL